MHIFTLEIIPQFSRSSRYSVHVEDRCLISQLNNWLDAVMGGYDEENVSVVDVSLMVLSILLSLSCCFFFSSVVVTFVLQ